MMRVIHLSETFCSCRIYSVGKNEGVLRLFWTDKSVVKRSSVVMAGLITVTQRLVKRPEKERNDDGQVPDK